MVIYVANTCTTIGKRNEKKVLKRSKDEDDVPMYQYSSTRVETILYEFVRTRKMFEQILVLYVVNFNDHMPVPIE